MKFVWRLWVASGPLTLWQFSVEAGTCAEKKTEIASSVFFHEDLLAMTTFFSGF
jgi:hypothetical protein